MAFMSVLYDDVKVSWILAIRSTRKLALDMFPGSHRKKVGTSTGFILSSFYRRKSLRDRMCVRVEVEDGLFPMCISCLRPSTEFDGFMTCVKGDIEPGNESMYVILSSHF